MCGKKRTYESAFKPSFVVWDRLDIVACSCSKKSYLHVHCPCGECDGKAASRKVELVHWKCSQLYVKQVKQDESFQPRKQHYF